jgi:hypothetical protein
MRHVYLQPNSKEIVAMVLQGCIDLHNTQRSYNAVPYNADRANPVYENQSIAVHTIFTQPSRQSDSSSSIYSLGSLII